MNTNNLIEKLNYNGTKDTSIYLTKSAYGQYKIGNTINTDIRTPQLNIGSFWRHKLLCKIEVKGLTRRLETNILKDIESQGYKRDREMFLIRGNQKTTEEVIQIFKDAVSMNINEMRKQIRAEQRYESKILAPHGIDINPKTTVARA